MRLMVQNPPLGGPESGGWAGDRAWPGAAGEAAGWAVARRVVAGVRGGAWAGDPSLAAGGTVVGAGKWGELQH